jgi:hypothetical protein
VRRAVRYLVDEAGIRQLIDIGTGLPTMGNVHEVAIQANPAARVVYVDHDPVVHAHARHRRRRPAGQGRGPGLPRGDDPHALATDCRRITTDRSVKNDWVQSRT